jgi:putative sterol carrier protein
VLAYLSDEWISAMDEALRAHPALRASAADVSLVIEQAVTGGPGGDRAYRLRFDHGEVAAAPAPDAGESEGSEPDIRFSCDWDTAVAVATGKESAQAAFLAGRLRLGGDSRRLTAHAGLLSPLDDVFAAVRSRTDFAP